MALITRREALAGGLSLCTFRVWASDFPNKPINIIIAYAAGSTPDIIVRLLEPHLIAALGQKIVVEPKPGASGAVAMTYASQQPADGYTLIAGGASNFVINQFVYQNLGFDPLKDFVPVAKLAEIPLVYIVNPKVPVDTLDGLVRYARENPGALAYGSPSTGTVNHLVLERLKLREDINMLHVPFGSAPPAILALLANDIQVMLIGVQVALKYIENGDVKALAVTSGERTPVLPNVPTSREVGIDDVIDNWWGLSAPAGTSEDVINTIHQAVQTAFKDPAVIDHYAKTAMIIPEIGNKTFFADMRKEAEEWREFISDPRIAKALKP